MATSKIMKVLSDGGRFTAKYPSFPAYFPMEWFNEQHADLNHGQTLDELNQRGGMSVQEMVCNIKQQGLRHFNDLTEEGACRWLLSYQEQKQKEE